jgi:DNA gyrase subunit A
MEYTHGKIMPIEIHDEVKKSFLDYAMSVIVSRALPDVRDGLKPVHRRILYAMQELGMNPDKPHKKSARLVGEVLGKYHPHGDVALYDTLVRLAQDFNTRYPLVDGHGNFGSLDGDPPAAMRYTEVRMAPIALELLADINKKTVDFRPNFDDTLEEPVVLPSRFPNLLVNGSAGIAVGMATNIPPQNLGEVCEAIFHLILNPEADSAALMQYIKGPDFPTGGLIMGVDGIRSAYLTGRGIIKMRGVTQIERVESTGRMRILITEIPYQVNKAKLIERIAELVREKKVEGITDLRDETARQGVRVVMELKKGANPQVILNNLYKNTALQQNFGIIMLALVDGKPKVLNLKEMLQAYLAHQKEIIERRTRFELDKAEKRAHIIEGLRIALDNLDAVIKLIRASRTTEDARRGLMAAFDLSEAQAQSILDMRLQKLTGLEREKLEEEYLDLIQKIAYYKEVLANERLVYEIIRSELMEIKRKHGDPRRTQIVPDESEILNEDLIAEENVLITLTHQGFIKRSLLSTYRSQHRGGKGVSGMTSRQQDFVEDIFVTSTKHTLLCFSNRGKVYHLKAYEIPEVGRTARGTNIVNLLALEDDENITAVIPMRTFNQEEYLVQVTSGGYIKKTPLADYANSRRGGLAAITLKDDDELIAVKRSDGKDDILLVTQRGMAIRFHEEDVRSMGRTARGVIGIRLQKGDRVVGMDLVTLGDSMLLVTERGFGKRTGLQEFRPQTRGGKGLVAMKVRENRGTVAGFKVVKPGDDLVVVTSRGIIIRQAVNEISIMGRYAQGVTLIKINPDDKVVSLARTVKED